MMARKKKEEKEPRFVDDVVRDSMGRYAHGGRPVSHGAKGSSQQKRADDILEKVTSLHRRIQLQQGDPIAYLEKAIKSLAPIEICLQAVGVTHWTLDKWKQEIENESPRAPVLREFFEALESQRANAVVEILAKLREIGSTNDRCWISLAWILERTHQRQFVVNRDKPGVQVNVAVTAQDALSQAEVAAASYRHRQISPPPVVSLAPPEEGT